MDKSFIILFQLSLVVISIIYFYRTKKIILKGALLFFGLTFLGYVIRKLSGIQLIGIISFVGLYFASIIFFIIHLIKDKNIKIIDRLILGIIILPALVSFLLKGFHWPGYGIVRVFSIIPIGLIVYLNFKKLNQLREELRVVDLYGVIMLVDLIIFIDK